MFDKKFVIKQNSKYMIYGGFVGDSIGACLRSLDNKQCEKIIHDNKNFNKKMISGGIYDLMPGQLSDNSEICITTMFIFEKNKAYDQNIASKEYKKWLLSNPFNVNNTVKNSIICDNLNDMLWVSKKYNNKSMNNSFMVRIPGIVVFYYDRSVKDLLEAVVQDINLTHSNQEIINIGIIYALILHSAINGKSACEIFDTIKHRCKYSPLLLEIYKSVTKNLDYFTYAKIKYEKNDICKNDIQSFVGFSLWLLLKCLVDFKSYEQAILYTLSCGGDTNTNSMIVGFVFGALYPETIPVFWLNTILSCKPKNRITMYPKIYPKIWNTFIEKKLN